MRCEFGYCLICDKEIATKCSHCSSKTKNGAYTEVQLKWSNGSKMQMAVCTDCAPAKVWKADKTEMTKAVWDSWDKMGHTYSKDIVLA